MIYKCIHYHSCSTLPETLCNDSKCKINRYDYIVTNKIRRARVRNAIKEYKKSLGIKSFLDLNKKIS